MSNNKKRGLHTTEQRIDAVYNAMPYKKEKIAIPNDKSQVSIAIRDSLAWNTFFEPKSLPENGDWLQAYPQEKKGESFKAWYNFIKKRCKIWANLTNINKNSIGLITVGNFNIHITKQLHPLFTILSEVTKVYYFGLNIEILKPIPTDGITSRYNASCNNKQLQTTSIEHQLKQIIRKYRNLHCLIGISIIDLYPDESWNFVFGEASVQNGVGIFSFARYFPGFYELDLVKFVKNQERLNKLKSLKALIDGEVTKNDKHWLNKILDEEEQILFIRRCLGVLLHEIGHLFGLGHCAYFECIMNGANHLEESDKAPLHLCPVCLHKLYFASRIMDKTQKKKHKKNKNDHQQETQYLDILSRYKQLSILYAKYGLIEESKWCHNRAEFIQPSKKENMNMDNDENVDDDEKTGT